jgi:hypothetical protein
MLLIQHSSTGAYDYQKAQVGGYNYEIECHVNVGAGTRTTGLTVSTMEQCIQQCSNANNILANSCLSIQWDALLFTCGLYTAAAAEPLYIATIRSARLLTTGSIPPYPLIDDQQYLIGNQSAYNIGLCGGSGANAYAGTRLNFQTADTGLYQTTNAQIWNECNGRYYPGSGTLSVAGVMAGLNAAQSTYTYQMPASADDCARFCAYSALAPSGYTGPTGCRGYQWDNTNTCTLATGAGTVVTLSSTIVAAGRWQGSGFLPTDTPAGYKLRARQTGGLRQF